MGRWARGGWGWASTIPETRPGYMQTGGTSSPFSPGSALARPFYTNLPSLLTLFPPPPLSFLPTPFASLSHLLPSPDYSAQEEETSHSCAQFFILNGFGWGAEQGSLLSKRSFWCLSSQPPQPTPCPPHPLPSLLSSSWVHVVIKEDCWCVINLFKRKKSKTRNLVPTEAYFNFILLFSSC